MPISTRRSIRRTWRRPSPRVSQDVKLYAQSSFHHRGVLQNCCEAWHLREPRLPWPYADAVSPFDGQNLMVYGGQVTKRDNGRRTKAST